MSFVPNEYKSVNFHGAAVKRPGFSGLNLSAAENVSLKIWLILAAAFLAILILAYAGLWFYQGRLDGQAADLNKKNDEMLARLDQKAVKNLIDTKTNAEIISGLLKNHKLTSRLIDALAAATLPRVQWLSLAAALDKNSLTLSGQAADYNVLAKQMTALKEDNNWQNVEISNIALGKDGFVSFGLNMDFDAKVTQ